MTNLLQWQKLPVQIIIAFGIGLLFGVASLWSSPFWVLVGLSSIYFLVVTISKPELGLLAILVITSSIVFEDNLPLIPIGIGSLNVGDVLLLLLLALIIVRSLVEPEFKLVHTPLDLPLLVFLGMTILSTFIAMANSSVSTSQALRGIRTISYFLTFFIVTNLVFTKRKLSLLIEGLVMLATIVAAAMIAQFFVGTSFALFPGRIETLITQGSTYAGVTRVLPPGESLVMFGFIFVWVSLVIDNSRSLPIFRLFQAGLLSFAVILTFNRSFYVMGCLAIAILAYLVRGDDRRRLLRWSVLAVLAGAVVFELALVQSAPRITNLVQGALARFGTLTSSETLQENSMKDRYIENSYAFPQLVSHPIIGLGLRTPYRPWDQRLDGYRPYELSIYFRSYIHNGHFWVLMTSGWLGYLGLVWFSIGFILRGLKNWRCISNARMRTMMLACVLTSIGVLIANIVNPIYTQSYWIPVLGIMMGTGETIIRVCNGESSD